MSVTRCDVCSLPMQWCAGHRFYPHERPDAVKAETDTQATLDPHCRRCEAVLDPGWFFCRRCGKVRAT